MASAEVREINAVICVDGYSSWPRTFWKRIFLDLHRLRIDARHFIGGKLTENGNPFAVDGNPIRMRIRRGRILLTRIAGKFEASDRRGGAGN
jgi:hypothetical protein